ncbi:Phosphate/phosphoenolpyruvate translocator protein [Tritrichomonas foetus]|uniref:Phosphate/phosphoenolpyruvate translocator protein n=1 Tax=Tritrichomonas foetus TaxID=1144522 RepID=A0A1J4KPR8_9EUKA|nr:Phosphate/phosphoenolpyruvate translocator protein [Tritrichomonas foetus]|eukprot:OHT13287.1 Phosphate/phosphoenolpyruvate translocator protein [Tritrichomonas foetus]
MKKLAKYVFHPSRLYISLWFILNVSLTLLNKSIMEFNKFKFPISLSFIHMATSTFLSFIMTCCFHYNPSEKQIAIQARPDYDNTIMKRIINLSFLFALNIIFGNVSIRYCSVAFVQIVRAIIPMITMILSVIFLNSKFSKWHYLSCFVVCIGVAFSCFGEINLTKFGLFVTVFGCFLSAAKSISVKLSLTGNYELHSFDLLQRMSPIAAIEMFGLILLTGENKSMVDSKTYEGSFLGIIGCLISGVFAFILNLTNFLATFHTSPLTVTIVGCVKQVLTIILSVIIFDKKITMTNIFGIVVTTFGSLWYGLLKMKKAPKTELLPMSTPSSTNNTK